MAFLRKSSVSSESATARAHRLALIADLTFELVPMKGAAAAIEALPIGARVSVTCSPAKGIAATQRLVEKLVEKGFETVPHLSARAVRDRSHTIELAHWLRSVGVTTAFVIGGDADPQGSYNDAVGFLRDLLETDHGLTTIGVAAYPDGHPFIAEEVLNLALHEKESLLDEAAVKGYATTQMCFDPSTVAGWLLEQRKQGMRLPVDLGVAGVVDKRKLMTMGVRLGIGASLRYVRKNRAAVTRMLTSTSYDPNELLVALSRKQVLSEVGGLHMFTFNQVATTESWRRQAVGEVGS